MASESNVPLVEDRAEGAKRKLPRGLFAAEHHLGLDPVGVHDEIQRHGLLGAVAPVAFEDPIEGLITALERRAGLQVSGIGLVGRGMNPSRDRGEEAAGPVRRVEPQNRPGFRGAGPLDKGFDES